MADSGTKSGDGSLRIAIVGAGIGGLNAAIVMRTLGLDVSVYEQAREFGRIGAAIQLTPNAVRILDRLGLGEAVRSVAWQPPGRVARAYDSAEILAQANLGDAAEHRFGAPVLTLHRADLLNVLENAIADDVVTFRRRLVGLDESDDEVVLQFEGGPEARADAVIGADGIHSAVRANTLGDEPAHYTGMVAFRSIVPMERLRGDLDEVHLNWFTKWWGPTRQSQLVTFPISDGNEFFLFATVPTSGDRPESWSMVGSVDELRQAFTDYHRDARTIVAAASQTLKTALYDRDPLDRWTVGRSTLLGDACHAMTPFMAQGAAMSMEDGVIIAHQLAAVDRGSVSEALEAYERARRPRTDKVQLQSRENWWLRDKPDPSWVYGYDAWEDRNIVAELTPAGDPMRTG